MQMILIFMLISFLVIIISINSFKTLPRFIKDCNILYCIDEIPSSISILTNYNNDYLTRNRKGRLEGKNSKVVELERAQGLKADGIKKEREVLRNAILCIRKYSDELTLGIMAGTGVRAISCLRAWVSGLNLPRGVLRAVDENNDEVEISKWDNLPVYLKYNSTAGGDCYMKPYNGGFVGVIFQPKIKDDNDFYQFGDLPLGIFL